MPPHRVSSSCSKYISSTVRDLKCGYFTARVTESLTRCFTCWRYSPRGLVRCGCIVIQSFRFSQAISLTQQGFAVSTKYFAIFINEASGGGRRVSENPKHKK